jgi:hydrogenase expression/formation protein HypC
MCLSIPGKVVEIGTNRFIIDYVTEKREVNLSLVDVKLGDYVIVSNKIIISLVPKEKAEKFFELVGE